MASAGSGDSVSGDKLLSDVHVHLAGHPAVTGGTGVTVSRFFFRVPKALEKNFSVSNIADKLAENQSPRLACDSAADDSKHGTGLEFDEDGDLLVQRPEQDRNVSQGQESVITISHAMATELKDVGQQVWLGALLLCDFLLHTSGLLNGSVILDLGAGVGLTSIVAALSAKTVFCTDHGDNILRLAKENVENNCSLPLTGDVLVRELDWMAESPLGVSDGQYNEGTPFSLTAADTKLLQRCTVLLAAEVVYDLDLTDAFFRVLYGILADPPTKVVYMTVEKRQVFTTADKDVVSPAYTHFRENLADLSSIDEGPVRFVCSQIDASFPRYFKYERTKELELWKIESVFPNG